MSTSIMSSEVYSGAFLGFSRIPKHVCHRLLQLIRGERLGEVAGSAELGSFDGGLQGTSNQ